MTVRSLAILYESEACLVVGKPPGLLTQAPPGIDCLEVRIRDFLRVRDGRPADAYLGIPHRLDRPASGAMLFGKTRRATRRLAEQFEHRSVAKVYWACVAGPVAPRAGTWSDLVRKVPGEARAEIVAPDHPEARSAVLHYRVLDAFAWGSWLEIELETGRTHQIRIQAASRGHPLLGDLQYGSTVPFGTQHEDVRRRAIALHARAIGFRDPKSRKPVSVTAPVADDWLTLGIPAAG
jgi:RluA family pseudouridine synthase